MTIERFGNTKHTKNTKVTKGTKDARSFVAAFVLFVSSVFARPTAAQPVFSRDVAPIKGLDKASLLIDALYWKYGDPKASYR